MALHRLDLPPETFAAVAEGRQRFVPVRNALVAAGDTVVLTGGKADGGIIMAVTHVACGGLTDGLPWVPPYVRFASVSPFYP